MNRTLLFLFLACAENLLCLGGLFAITLKKRWADYWSLGALLAVRAVANGLKDVLSLSAFRQSHLHSFYRIYFYTYWVAFAVESVLALIVLYSMFNLTVGPLDGLRKLGRRVFGVAAALSVIVLPLLSTTAYMTGTRLMIQWISQLQRNESLLIICLLAGFWFALRPAGISFRSPIFGVALGLGLLAFGNLVQSAWMVFRPSDQSIAGLINGAIFCVTLIIWTGFLSLPEPERGDIAGPLLRWNARLM